MYQYKLLSLDWGPEEHELRRDDALSLPYRCMHVRSASTRIHAVYEAPCRNRSRVQCPWQAVLVVALCPGKRLSDTDWDKLEQLLRTIKNSRSTVLEAMVFCMDHSDWAIEISECITESLTILETDWPLKMARRVSRLCVGRGIGRGQPYH